MDQIKIEGLEVYASHGVYPEETKNGQIFLIDAVLYTDLGPAGKSDDLTLTTDYGEVCQFIATYLTENTFMLIEAAAEHLARKLLIRYPLIQSLELEIKKPHAPINLTFSSVSVRIERGWKLVYLGIGSNMGDRQGHIDKGIQGLKGSLQIKDLRCSKLITTVPYGGVEQEDFLNGAIELKTLFSPFELLSFLHKLEDEAHRERKIHWGPRTLDLDILFYQDFISDGPALTVPHQDMENRLFVLEPLNEICPYYCHPVTGKSIRQMLTELKERK